MNIRGSFFGSLLLIASAVMAADARIDAAKSSIVVTFKQMNVPVEAPFRSFGGHIDYDPAHPEAAQAELQVDTGSLDLGDEDYNAETRKKEWFDSAASPEATFVATAIKPASGGRLEATGTLTIKNKSQTVTVPVTVGTVTAARTFDATFEISRSYFGIGGPDWKDTVDDRVTIKIHLLQAVR